MPECLEVSAWTEEREIMGLRHHEYEVEVVKFHPKSILTNEETKILKTFFETRRITS